ncbi:Glycosyltransferase AglE [uncultured archaeon]|nr:Glycosyltransferase AglE [uncultured archaeon]
MTPKVSVVMAVRNEERYIRQAIESILNQTHADLELIIVDDASTDATPQVIDEYAKKDSRVRVITLKKPAGVCAATNTAIKAALGEYVAVMDGNDIAMAGRIEEEAGFLAEHPQISCVSSPVILLDEEGNEVGERKDITPGPIEKLPKNHNPIVNSTAIFRKKDFLAAGGYPDTQYAGDRILWEKMLKQKMKIQILPKPLLKYRLHTQGLTNAMYAGEGPQTRRQYLWTLSSYLLQNKKNKEAKTNLTKLIKEEPTRPKYWLYLLLSLMPTVASEKAVNLLLPKIKKIIRVRQ